MTDVLSVGVTGASGYLGGHITAALAAAGHHVVRLGRQPLSGAQVGEARPFDLSRPLEPGVLDGLDAVVHAAYDLTVTRAADVRRVNLLGTQRLAAEAQRSGTRYLVLSSMSAYDGTRQLYGRTKLAMEREALSLGGTAIRPGLVYGDDLGGMAATLARLARLPVLPVLGGAASRQFTVHVDDLAAGVVAVVEGPPLRSVLGLAHPAPVPIAQICAHLGDTTPRTLSVPWRPVYAALRLAELVRVPLPVRADSLLGLVRPAPAVPNVDLWQRLGVSVRPFPSVVRG